MTPRDLEERTAQRDAALDVVDALLRVVKQQGGYTTPEQQAIMRVARALLAEAGRSFP